MIWIADPKLAGMAQAEVASRQKHLPGMIERGEIERGDGETDLEAWRAIGAMLAIGNGPDADRWIRNPRELVDTDLNWGTLELAAARALASLVERSKASPTDHYLAKRRDAAAEIHGRLAEHRAFWTGARHRPAVAQAA